MPEVFRTEGYVFSFYSNEGNEPLHIHVRRAAADSPNSGWSPFRSIIRMG